MQSSIASKLNQVASATLVAVLILVPFHALLTVSASLVVGNYELLRLWKELLLIALVPVAAWSLWRRPEIWRRLRGGWLFWAIMAYVALHLVLGLLALYKGQVNVFAMAYAWIVNLRPMLVLVLAWIFAMQTPWMYGNWKRILLIPAAIVIGFGLLQVSVLPYDALSRIGYGPQTIDAYQTVDEKLEYVRVQSTLRGANPLGAYLVVVLAAVAVLLRRGRDRVHTIMMVLFASGLAVMLFTYSRSAYIGLALSAMAVLALLARSKAARRRLGVSIVVLAIVLGGALVALRDNDQVQNALFHTDENSISATSSNEVRSSVMRQGVQDLVREPFGRGPGTAGPASAHNMAPARIAENYYVQIGQETGWLGLGLFLAIVLSVGRRLWRRRDDVLARSLLVALIGVSFVNLVQHAWTDDTLAILWWGMAGIALAIPLSGHAQGRGRVKGDTAKANTKSGAHAAS